MDPNIQRLMDAGILKPADVSGFPESIRQKLAALTTEDVDALIQLGTRTDPEALKALQNFILP